MRGRRLAIIIDGFNVAEILDTVKLSVDHSNFFTLINVRRTLMKIQNSGEKFRGLHVILAVISKARDGTRLIVVTQVQTVPFMVG